MHSHVLSCIALYRHVLPCATMYRHVLPGIRTPTNVPELRRLIGMVNYLGRFIPNLASVMRPMSELLKSDTT